MTRQFLLACLTLALPGTAWAQSMQRVSLQGSAALVFGSPEAVGFPALESATRLGWEGQVRYTFSRFSLGGGYQRATIFQNSGEGQLTAAVRVGFLEPRYILAAGSRAAFYAAARLGLGNFACTPKADCPDDGWKPAFGGGGGVLVLFSDRASLDIGSQWFSFEYGPGDQSYRPGYVLARVGLSLGL